MDLLSITFASALALGGEHAPLASIWPETIGETPAHVPAPEPVRSEPPARSWVWLRSQGCYGYGYPRADGLWVIDPGSKVYPRAYEPAPAGPVPALYNPAPVLFGNYGNYGGCAGGPCGAGFR